MPAFRGLHNTCYRTLQGPRRAGPHFEACAVSLPTNTILGWNSVPATRVATAISSLCPLNTFTCCALENSGRFTVRPLRMCAAISSLAVTDGKRGKKLARMNEKIFESVAVGCGLQLLEGVGIGQLELRHCGSPQRFQVGATSHSLAHIVGDGTQVGS